MSVRKVGHNYVVRWRDASGRHRQQATGPGRRGLKEANDLQAEVKRAARLGQLAQLDAGAISVSDYADEFWSGYVVNKKPRTQQGYANALNKHILPRLGKYELRQLKPGIIRRFAADMEASGTGPGGRRKTLMCLSSLLQRACEDEKISSNPVQFVDKPEAGRKRTVEPIEPEQVEAIRAELDEASSMLVGVLAYTGMRPHSEALQLRWRDIDERVITVQPGKTGRSRTVRLFPQLRAELLAWRMRCGNPGPDAPVFPNREGQTWKWAAYRSWARKSYGKAAQSVGVSPRPYDLRHSFVSLLLAERKSSVLEIARQAGHSASMTLNVYGHVIEKTEGKDAEPAEHRIQRAQDNRSHTIAL